MKDLVKSEIAWVPQNTEDFLKKLTRYDSFTLTYNIVKRIIPVPAPHCLKQQVVKEYANRFSLTTFIETGTNSGAMVNAVKNTFCRIFSIEIDEILFKQAKKRFKKFKHISIIHGDSGKILPSILSRITEPCLFWLDGHYISEKWPTKSLKTPIRSELMHILNHTEQMHVLLIDDARLFIGRKDYPTMKELSELITKKNPSWTVEVKDDIIRCQNLKA